MGANAAAGAVLRTRTVVTAMSLIISACESPIRGS